MAEEVRAGLADLGLRSLDELIGRADLLKQRDVKLAKTQGLDLSFITAFAGECGPSSSRQSQEVCTALNSLGTRDSGAQSMPVDCIPGCCHRLWWLGLEYRGKVNDCR